MVGGGPAGSACAYWLAEAGWDVAVVEKKVFPRAKTCGDGLTPRAVRQLADMGVEGALVGAHRYRGLRAYGFGQSMELPWPEHPSFPNYGYTITRHDLDGIVNERAAKAGATVWQGTEAVEPIAPTEPADPGWRRPAWERHRPAVLRRGAVRSAGDYRAASSRGAGPLRGGGRRFELALRAGARRHP